MCYVSDQRQSQHLQSFEKFDTPRKPENETFENLAAALRSHFKPAPSEIVERFRFHSRCNKLGDSMATYVTELRSLAEFCNFGDMLEGMTRKMVPIMGRASS